MSVQVVPPSEQLLATMPSGREYHTPRPYVIPTLDEEAIVRMRAPPDPGDAFEGEEEDSAEEEERAGQAAPVGAFPGTKGAYGGGSSYY